MCRTMHITAGDGRRLVRIVIPGAAGLSQDLHLIVPGPAVKVIIKMLGDKRAQLRDVEPVTLRRSKTLFALETTKAAFISKLIEGTFPDYTKLLPKPSGNSITVDRAALMQALERVGAVAEEQQRRIAGLTWAANEPALRLCLVDADTADDAIPAEEVNGSGRTAAQIGLLVDVLDALEDKCVCLDSPDGASPIIVTAPDDEFLALQMPCTWMAAQAAA